MRKRLQTAKTIQQDMRRQDIAEIKSFNELFDQQSPDGMNQVMARLLELATSKAVDDIVNIKAIELIVSYRFGKPVEKPTTPADPTQFTIQHNVIGIEEAKKLKR